MPVARRLPLVLATLAAAVVALSGCRAASGPSDAAAPVGAVIAVEDRTPAPVLTGESLQGELLDMADYSGQVVVLNFWADWCAPCRAEAPFLKAVAEKTADSGVQFLGVNVKDDRTAATLFERRQAIPYPSIFDQPATSLTRFRGQVPQSPPSTVVVDREGRVAAVVLGGVTESELLPLVRRVAAE